MVMKAKITGEPNKSKIYIYVIPIKNFINSASGKPLLYVHLVCVWGQVSANRC